VQPLRRRVDRPTGARRRREGDLQQPGLCLRVVDARWLLRRLATTGALLHQVSVSHCVARLARTCNWESRIRRRGRFHRQQDQLRGTSSSPLPAADSDMLSMFGRTGVPQKNGPPQEERQIFLQHSNMPEIMGDTRVNDQRFVSHANTLKRNWNKILFCVCFVSVLFQM